jgi:hypothetical protein
MDAKAFAYGNSNQRSAYLRFFEGVTHCTLDDLLQPELNRTFKVTSESLEWLADGMAKEKFGSSELAQRLLALMEELQDISDDVLA